MRMPRFACLLGLLVLLSAPLGAQELSLYEGETPVASQQPGEREAALPRALAQVLVKLTGDPKVATDPAVAESLGQAGSLLQQYRYRSLDATGARLALIASFARSGVDALLAAAGRQSWPEPRPQPLVWLAIDDGRGARLVSTAQAGAVAALTRRAEQRGLRLTYPLLDLEDQQALDAARVWRGDLDAVRTASARYPSQATLVGKLYRGDAGWIAEWQVLESGQPIDQLRVADADAAVVLAAGAELAADSLARRFTREALVSGPPGLYRISVAPIRSAEDYARLIGYLQGLSIVRGLQPIDSVGERLQLELDLATGLEGLVRLADGGGVLAAEPAESGEDVRRFRLEP